MSFLKKSIIFTLSLIILVACASHGTRTHTPEITISPPIPQSTRQIAPEPFLLASWTMGELRDIAWNPNSKMFAVNYSVEGSDNNLVQAFDVETLNSLWIAENSLAWDLIFSPDGNYIVESNTNVPFFYWRNIEQGKVIRRGEFTELSQIKLEDCNGGGQVILADSRKNTALIADYSNLLGPRTSNLIVIRQLDFETGKCKNLFDYQGSFDIFDLNSKDTYLVYGGMGEDDSVIIWDVEKQAEVCRTSKVQFGRFVPNENTLAVIREQKTIFIDASTCQKIREMNVSPSSENENYFAFSPDGEEFAVARDMIQIISVSSGEIVVQLPFPEKAIPISSKLFLDGIKFSPDGRYLLVAYHLLDSVSYSEVQLWQLKP